MAKSDLEPDTVFSKVWVIHGPAGVGKTDFTRYVVSRLPDDWNMIWIQAETKTKLKDSFIRLAKYIGVGAMRLEKEEEMSVIVEDCYKFLCRVKSVFIFDNSEEWEKGMENGIEEFLPFSGFFQPQWKKPIIFITSRSQAWPGHTVSIASHLTS